MFMYLIYGNDIPKCSQGHMLSFADHTYMYICDLDLYRRVNIAMDDLYDWCGAHRLSLSPKNTNFIVIKPLQRHSDCINFNVCRNNVPLTQISSSVEEKYYNNKFRVTVLAISYKLYK